MDIGNPSVVSPGAPYAVARATGPFMVSSNGFSWPVQRYTPGASKLFGVYEKWFVSDDYWTANPRFGFVNSYLTANGAGGQEAANGNDITIEAVSLQVGVNGSPVQLTIAGSAAAYTLVNDTEVWTDAPNGVVIPPGTRCCVRVARAVPNAASTLCGQYPGASIMFGDRVENSTTSLAAKVMAGGISGTTPGTPDAYAYGPAMMVAQGWDGRPCVLGFGTSIDAGAGPYRALRTPTGACSYLERGMDSKAGGALRLPFCNWAVAGSLAAGIAGVGANQGLTRRMRLVGTLPNVPFTATHSGYGTNDVGATFSVPQAAMVAFWAAIATAWPMVRRVQGSLMPRTQSTDGFQTQANQSGQTANWTYPTGTAWSLDAFIRQPNNRFIDATIDLLDACDGFSKGGQRGKWRTDLADRGIATTLSTSSAISAGQFDLPIYLPIGSHLTFNDGSPETLLVTGVSGTGPFTHFTQTAATAAHTAGAAVVQKAPITDGTHPGTDIIQSLADGPIAQAKLAGAYG